jgi:hypothetical protein
MIELLMSLPSRSRVDRMMCERRREARRARGMCVGKIVLLPSSTRADASQCNLIRTNDG